MAEVVLPRGADTTGDAGCARRASEVQHQVAAGWCTGHASSLLLAAVVHFPLRTLSHLDTVRLCGSKMYTEYKLVGQEKHAAYADMRATECAA